MNSSNIGHASNPGLLTLNSDSLVIGSNTTINAGLTVNNLTLGSTALTSTASDLNKLDGISTTSTGQGYVNGVTSSIQTQLNNRYTKSEADSAFIANSELQL